VGIYDYHGGVFCRFCENRLDQAACDGQLYNTDE
jgi:hypothetical protein